MSFQYFCLCIYLSVSDVGMTEKISMATPLSKLIRCVILDLDGTLLNTGQFCHFSAHMVCLCL